MKKHNIDKLKKPVAFMHVATLHHYQEIVDDVLVRAVNSKLLDDLDFLQLNLVGEGDVDISIVKDKRLREKIKITRVGVLSDFDMATIKILNDFARSTPHTPILFLQTLSVSDYNYNIPGYKDRRDLFFYFTITQYKKCLSYLQDYDTCSVQWNKDWPKFKKYSPAHWSGNMWWTTSDYIKTLPSYEWMDTPANYVLDRRHQAEFFIGFNPQVKYKSLYTWAFKNLKKEALPESMYIDNKYNNN